jgi:hypothetical protein
MLGCSGRHRGPKGSGWTDRSHTSEFLSSQTHSAGWISLHEYILSTAALRDSVNAPSKEPKVHFDLHTEPAGVFCGLRG